MRKEHQNEDDTLILDELALCQGDARIDIAVVNGSMSGYEIKSESDTLERLPKQSDTYNRVFDTVTIFTASRFIEEIEDIIPNWWGITKAEMEEEGIVHFFQHRIPEQNPNVDPFAITQLLWKEEALSILKERDLHKGYLSKPRQVLWKVIAESLELNDLKNEVRNKLKARTKWRVH
ncbi:sce7726 family protein [Paenibacillus yanchengensis]|uniref:Sce7726 family protein n=1 Tax=Paenibacillus yanchengensis TaxID=2035833 RepID=A0ABW4YKZ4_9BACL